MKKFVMWISGLSTVAVLVYWFICFKEFFETNMTAFILCPVVVIVLGVITYYLASLLDKKVEPKRSSPEPKSYTKKPVANALLAGEVEEVGRWHKSTDNAKIYLTFIPECEPVLTSVGVDVTALPKVILAEEVNKLPVGVILNGNSGSSTFGYIYFDKSEYEESMLSGKAMRDAYAEIDSMTAEDQREMLARFLAEQLESSK